MQNLMQLSITNLKKVLTLFLILGLLLTSTADSFGQGKLKRQGGSTGPGLGFVGGGVMAGSIYSLDFENQAPYMVFNNVIVTYTFQSGSYMYSYVVNFGTINPLSTKTKSIPIYANAPLGQATITINVSYEIGVPGGGVYNETFGESIYFLGWPGGIRPTVLEGESLKPIRGPHNP